MAKTGKVPTRKEVNATDTWDLTKIFKDDAAWERGYKRLEKMVPAFEKFRGKLGRSAKTLREVCELENTFGLLAEHLGVYAYLKYSEDVSNSAYQGMVGRYTYLATRAGEAASWIAPEVQAIPKARMKTLLADKQLAPFRFSLEKLLRYRPHILSEREERLLAMQGEVAGTASKVFSQLNDADLTFGTVKDDKGREVELSHASLRSLLESPKRAVRKQAFEQYYKVYEGHANTLAASLSSAVLQDIYQARVRNFPSALEASLFSDKVPVSVYDSLIEAIHANLKTMHKYLAVRQKALKLKEIHAYDTAVPIVKTPPVDIPYEEAVAMITDAVAPLGGEYQRIMAKGLLEGRWVDRYENKGKRSGAFSYGAYGTPPYILMNYRNDVMDSMFTLAHEAGHSMHSYFSDRNQPYHYAQYTILVAEVASTVNEQLLSHHLLSQVRSKQERARLICREIDEIRGTIIRQTMFAEFEKIIHETAEQGEPLTLETLRAVYLGLLKLYFGKKFTIDPQLDLEGLRIPHFYSAFYVYKYATGLSTAIAFTESILNGGAKERERYLNFLKAGGSKYPLEILKDAGVDLTQPDTVDMAMKKFKRLVDELEKLT